MDDQWDERPLYISIDLSCWEYCLFTSFFSFSVAHTRLYLLVALSYNSLTILLLLVAPTSLLTWLFLRLSRLLLSTIDLRHIHNRRRPQCPM